MWFTSVTEKQYQELLAAKQRFAAQTGIELPSLLNDRERGVLRLATTLPKSFDSLVLEVEYLRFARIALVEIFQEHWRPQLEIEFAFSEGDEGSFGEDLEGLDMLLMHFGRLLGDFRVRLMKGDYLFDESDSLSKRMLFAKLITMRAMLQSSIGLGIAFGELLGQEFWKQNTVESCPKAFTFFQRALYEFKSHAGKQLNLNSVIDCFIAFGIRRLPQPTRAIQPAP